MTDPTEERGVPSAGEMWVMFWSWIIAFLLVIIGVKYLLIFMFWLILEFLKLMIWMGL